MLAMGDSYFTNKLFVLFLNEPMKKQERLSEIKPAIPITN